MKREIFVFLSNFLIFLFLFIGFLFTYSYFFGVNYLEKHRLIATFFDSVLYTYKYFYGFFIFIVCIYFIFLFRQETKLYLKTSYKGYFFLKLYPFILLFFIIGIFFTLIFNLALPNIVVQRNKYKFSYDRYSFLEKEANKIDFQIKNIDIKLSSNKIFSSSDLADSMKKKKKYLEELISIYEKMRIIYLYNEELSVNYYLVKAEYSKIPNYDDVDLVKFNKVFSSYPFKNLEKQDFLTIINEFIAQNDYHTANYFAYIAFEATKDNEFTTLLNLTFKFINENKNPEGEKKYLISEEKRKNFLYLNTEKFELAYYGFLNLHKLSPNDSEILHYKNKSLEKLRKKYLFFDEIEKYFEYFGTNDVFLLQLDPVEGFYNYIYMQKVVNLDHYSKIIKNFELIRFDKVGNIILHIKIPFASLKGNTVYQNVLDKNIEQSKVTLTKIYVSDDNFDKNVLEVIKISENVENLDLFSSFSEDSLFLKIQDLIGVFNKTVMLNLKLIRVLSLSLILLIFPILLVLLGMFFIALSFKIEFNFNSRIMIFLASIMIASFSGIICFLINYFLIIIISFFIQFFNSIYATFIFILLLLLLFFFKIFTLKHN